MPHLTIFTPTHNRAYILPKLYESLCGQTCQDFEWLIVDDGSTDNTKELVDEWIGEGRIAIRYVYQQNGGKMRAYNKAASLADSELFVCVDSDDQLTKNRVVEESLAYWDKHKNDALDKPIVGMVSLRLHKQLAKGIPSKLTHGSLHQICTNYKGETTIFLLTAILRNYPYPTFEGENFITDVYIYDRMDEDYCFLFHPYYSQVCEYHEDGYTNSYRRLLFRNPRGYREYHAQRLRLKKSGMAKSMICYIALSLFIHDHTLFLNSPNKWMTILLYPLGCLKYVYDRYMLSREI